MSNARKKRKQAAIDRRNKSTKLLATQRTKFIWRIRWINFVNMIKHLLGVK